jgi:hypothetical protein
MGRIPALALLLLIACDASVVTPPPSSAGVFFPQHDLTPQAGVPTGDLQAQLRRVDDCLVLQSEGGAYLALWPAAYRLVQVEPLAIEADNGERLLDGEVIHVGGGLYPNDQRRFVEELIGEPIHRECHADGYWLVSELLP